jgi:mannose-6-phosphate isomerase-like protein (cupin superfamily)
MTTTVLNAYTWRAFSTFLDAVEARVAGAGARAKPVVLAQSGEGAVSQPGARHRPARRVLLLAVLLAGCVGRGPRGGLGALTTKLDAFLAAHPLAAPQALRIDRIDRTDTASYHVVQARGSEAPHRHETHDLSVLVLRGEGTLTLDGVPLPLKAGDMIFIRHDRVHWFAATGGEVAVAIAIFTPPLDAPDGVPVDSPGSGG